MPHNGSAHIAAAYARDAARYDSRTAGYAHYRERLVDLLPLRPGDTVVDVGCGTGMCFPLLRAGVGACGRVIGVDPAPDMLALAAARVAGAGWANVDLVGSPAADAVLPERVDHVLFCAVHDVLQDARALDHILGRVRDGGVVAAGGGKWAPPWAVALNAGVLALHAPYVADFTGFDRPWRLLAERVPGLDVREVAMGAGFLAVGVVRRR